MTAALALLACTGVAHAQAGMRAAGRAPGGGRAAPTDEEPGVVVRSERVTADRARVESGPRFATSIDARTRGALVANVGELLDDAPGVHARSSGDALLPTVVSVRGAPAAQVTVALDGVVLNDATSQSGVDLSLVPPALLERIDVYRGAAPARLGVAGLGGAIELVTRANPSRASAWVSGGYGSFGQRRANAAVAGSAGPVRNFLALSYRGTNGDFTFYDDHGTELDARDDRTSTRVNNAGDGIDALYRVCAGNTASPFCLLVLAGWRRHGLPGPGSAQLPTPEMEQARVLLRASTRMPLAPGGSAGWLEPYVVAMARRDAFRDYGAVVVPGQTIDAHSTGFALELGLTGRAHTASREVAFEPALRVRRETFQGSGALEPTPDAARTSALLGGEFTLRRFGVEALAGLAVDALFDQSSEPGTSAPPPVARALVSPRASVQVPLTRGGVLALRATAAHLERAPTLQELYGVGGFTVGNARLLPERSDTVDAGLVAQVRGLGPGVDARLEAVGFARHAADLIVLVRSSVLSLRPVNLRGADVLGGEVQARVAFRRYAALVASYAYTYAVTVAPGDATVNGRRPPSIPEHDAYVRLEGGYGPVRAWADVSFVSGIYFDEANLLAAPPRALISAAATFTPPFARWCSFTLMGTNLLDQRDGTTTVHTASGALDVRQPIADFAGYPLPGRAVFVALSFTTEPAAP